MKDKKPFYKKWWFWLIVAVAIIGIGGKDNTSPTTAPKQEQSSKAKKNDKPTNDEIKAWAASFGKHTVSYMQKMNFPSETKDNGIIWYGYKRDGIMFIRVDDPSTQTVKVYRDTTPDNGDSLDEELYSGRLIER